MTKTKSKMAEASTLDRRKSKEKKVKVKKKTEIEDHSIDDNIPSVASLHDILDEIKNEEVNKTINQELIDETDENKSSNYAKLNEVDNFKPDNSSETDHRSEAQDDDLTIKTDENLTINIDNDTDHSAVGPIQSTLTDDQTPGVSDIGVTDQTPGVSDIGAAATDLHETAAKDETNVGLIQSTLSDDQTPGVSDKGVTDQTPGVSDIDVTDKTPGVSDIGVTDLHDTAAKFKTEVGPKQSTMTDHQTPGVSEIGVTDLHDTAAKIETEDKPLTEVQTAPEKDSQTSDVEKETDMKHLVIDSARCTAGWFGQNVSGESNTNTRSVDDSSTNLVSQGQDLRLYPDLSQQIVDYSQHGKQGPLPIPIAPSEETPIISTAPQLSQLDEQTVSTRVVEQPRPREAIQTLTVDQLSSLYYNPQLELNENFIDTFVQDEIEQESHEFYEILLNYQRARKNLVQCEQALDTLQQQYEQLQTEIWVTETHTSTVKGTCGDNSNCTANHSYEQARLNETAVQEMKSVLEKIENKIQQELSLYSYSAQLSRLQVESYIHSLFVSSPVLRDIPRNLPVNGCDQLSTDISHQLDKLKTCISILFIFHRLPIEDEELVKNLQQWTERLVSACLRVCTFWDHLFILNHILRCPAGIGSWASAFVQIPTIPSNQDTVPLTFGNLCLDHAVTTLATVLIPTKSRSEFLCHMQKMFTPGPDQKTITWVMVDSDGEEDEDPQKAWMFLHENDVVSILKQVPLADIFRHIFFIVQSQFQDCYEYDIEKTTEAAMYRVFAFCTRILHLLGSGLHTYNMARYRQLNKRLGRMIRQCVQYVSDHWQNFRAFYKGTMSPESLHRLQAEFDAFFLRAVNHIHMSQRLGSCQFIADMPFDNISMDTMWKLLWLLHQGHGQSVEVSAIPTAAECMRFTKDASSRSQLCDIIQRVPVSDGVYLLNTMTNMTESCSSAHMDFVETITMTVFEVSYVCPETRDVCSKMGRELLSAVVYSHPFILSVLTRWVQESMDKLGSMGVYLYSGLPLEDWLPADPDILIVRQWLLNCDLGTPENQLAQLILAKINWGHIHTGSRLMVPWRVHKQVSVLVVEAYQKYVLGKNLGSAFMEGVKQISAAVQQYSTSEQEFNMWCWDLLLKLALHRRSLPTDDLRVMDMQGPAPNVNEDNALIPLVKGTKEKNPAACFVAVVLSRYGHMQTDFLSDGISQLEVLSSQGLYKATICAIYYTAPMFYSSNKYLLDSIRFQEVLLSILKADESYFKIVKGLLSYDFPGPITKLFINMIQSQIQDARTSGCQEASSVIEMWIKLILHIPKWQLDRNCCCVLESVLQATFTQLSSIESVMAIFQKHYKDLCHQEKHQGVVSALVSWVTSGTTLPTFLDRASCPEFSWLTYVLLTVEGNYEQTTHLWPAIHDELHSNPKFTVEQALKKSITKLKLEQAPVTSRLNIYRWAQQALDMSVDHPAAVLTWQKFFVLYLGRYVKNASLPQRASIGERFFTGMGYSGMVKKMKKRLGETADFYQKQSTDPAAVEGSPGSGSNRDRHEMFCQLVRMYQTFQLWVEETRLHDSALYLPSLPQQYQPDRLLMVFQNQTAPWLEFVDAQRIATDLETMAKEWRNTGTPDQNPKAGKPKTKHDSRSASERILSRLSRCDKPLPPPPVQPVKAPVPEISSTIIEDKGAILHFLESDLNVLKNFASQFCCKMNRQITKDHYYLNLIPNLYRNVPKEVTVSLKCTSMINPLHKCSKPGSAVVKIHEKWNDPLVQRDADENRADFKQLLVDNKLPPSQNVVICAVHTENAITMLVKLARSSTDERRQKALCSIACSLFFRFGSTVTDTVLKYPPTQQFFSACMDVLGKEFIQQDPGQVEDVLLMAIERPDLGGLLSPHFVPLLAPDKFVSLYSRLVETLNRKTLELTFMLLTKFDVGKWLSEYSPSGQEVTVFVEKMGQALTTCGADPDEEHRLVFGFYLGHEKILLRHQFPMYLHQVIAALLHGSSVGKLSVECWEVLQKHCFQDNNEDNERPHPPTQYPEVFTNLSIDEIRNLLYWFGHEFMQIRQKQKESMTFGLYPSWKRYIQHVANFLRDLSKCLIDKMIPVLRDATTNEGVDRLWQLIVEAFVPWLQPLYNNNNKIPSMPWIAADAEAAQCMVKAFTDLVGFAHYRTEDLRSKFYHNFLSLLWLYYAAVLSKPSVTSDVVAVFNMEIASLPWQQLIPDIQVMETMAEVKDNGSPLGFNLVADITAEIAWNDVVSWYDTYQTAEVRARFEGALFLILIQAFGEHKSVENPEMERVLHQAVDYKWQYMPSDAYRKACSYFLCGSDPKCLLVERTAPETVGLRLLKSASGFSVDISQRLTPDWSVRRVSFLHSLASLICQCTYVTDWDQSHLSTIIINLLTEIETIQSAVVDGYTREEESSDMAKEVLGLLNNCKPDGDGTRIVMLGIIQWLQESPQTLLLSPIIHAATRHLASIIYMCQIVEQCIELAFVPAEGRPKTHPWDVVLTAMVIPELSLTEFVLTCLQESSFLLLYAYVLQREPLCQNLTEEQGLIQMILDWTDKAKPGPENESKLLLWWHKALQLIIRQIEFGRDKATCVQLVKKFMHKVQSYGEDRVSGGLLGAIGLGKRSVLSERFRVCSRALVAFLSCQIISETQMRFQASDPVAASSAAKQDLSSLLALRSNKKYQAIKPEIEGICDFVKDLTKSFRNVFDLMSQLRSVFYHDKKYLSVVNSP